MVDYLLVENKAKVHEFSFGVKLMESNQHLLLTFEGYSEHITRHG